MLPSGPFKNRKASHSYWLRKYAGSLPYFHFMLQPSPGFWAGLMG